MFKTDKQFEIVSPHKPTGDQPSAIEAITEKLRAGDRTVNLLGATGTGKTFTMAHVIENLQRPALILSHNKTLAAQLYEEMKDLFPHNAVSFFVSYYDYYQPEAYIPGRDIYIEKDASRNDDLDRLRLAATSNLLTRKDTVVIASVSSIFGLGSPTAYQDRVITLAQGRELDRRAFLLGLAEMQYQRNEIEFARGQYRVRGDTIDVFPAYEQFAVRVELFGDEIERLSLIDPMSGEVLAEESMFFVFPAVHYVTEEETMEASIASIREELDKQVMHLRSEGKLLEAQRLLARTKYDMEMIKEVGYCSGIENYSRHLDGRAPGEKPYTLLDYFDHGPAAVRNGGTGWTLFIDESHVTIPQVRAMFNGDKARKTTLVEHGFRLPSALDNRPLTFEEFEAVVPQCVYVSATPAAYELERTGGEIVEQVIRPTGLLDPEIEIHSAAGQVPHLLEQCRERAARGERVLVTALTKRLSEDLTTYLGDNGVKVRYLHSDIDTLERVEILRDLRLGEFDVLIGVNLLREGLDLPEVSLVGILDADKTGFLRSATSLIQTIGRAARNVGGKVFLYADTMTPAMATAIEETERRRAKQEAYNTANGITPETIVKAVRSGIEDELKARKTARVAVNQNYAESEPSYARDQLLDMLEEEMLSAARSLEFEKAATLRDQLTALRDNPGLFDEGGHVKRSELDEVVGLSKKKKPGMPRSRAGITGKTGKQSRKPA